MNKYPTKQAMLTDHNKELSEGYYAYIGNRALKKKNEEVRNYMGNKRFEPT